jgi:hypothetical protein
VNPHFAAAKTVELPAAALESLAIGCGPKRSIRPTDQGSQPLVFWRARVD